MDFGSTWDAVVGFLGHPQIRAFATILSVISFVVSLWAMRRLHEVLTSHHSSMLAEQSRFLDRQWQDFNMLLLANRDVFELVNKKTPSPEEILRRENCYYYLITLLFSAYTAHRQGVVTEENCESHFQGVFHHFTVSGCESEFERILIGGSYPSDFISWCHIKVHAWQARSVGRAS
jgi:hypothetical protein